MKKTASLLAAVLFAASGAALAAGAPAPRMERFGADSRDLESLQRGARLFVNYCLNCHSAAYMRYNRLTDIGLTEQQLKDAEKKLKEMEETVKTVVKEKDLLAAKYKAAKEAIKKMQDQLR